MVTGENLPDAPHGGQRQRRAFGRIDRRKVARGDGEIHCPGALAERTARGTPPSPPRGRGGGGRKIGREASAETDVTLRAEMLSYSRSRGVFAGVSLEGSTLRPDNDANKKLYGQDATPAEIIAESKFHAPPAARKLIARLQKASPRLKP